MKPRIKILLIEDDPDLAQSLCEVLTGEGIHFILEARGDTALEKAVQGDFDVILTDMKLPGLDGLELVRRLHSQRPRLPVILMTAHGTTESAIEATRLGAYDYLVKPFDMDELLKLVEQASAAGRLAAEAATGGANHTSQDTIIGKSRVMQSIYKEIGRIADKPVPVLLRGETGTGKELVARAIFQFSHRSHKPFVAINCAAIPEPLLESELFGHERGAFTGAETRRIGYFEQAEGGTIFLDEIGDMAPRTQVKLMRVLQERYLQRVGGKDRIPVDVRVIAATNRDLEAGMREGQFRNDLYFRLSTVVLHLPPLRERREDIPLLAHYFLHKHGRELGRGNFAIQPEALELLQSQDWTGNVRELENVIRRALLLSRGFPVNADHIDTALNQVLQSTPDTPTVFRQFVENLLDSAERGELGDAHARVMEEAERELLRQAIRRSGGNQAQVARWLGVSRLTLREKLHRYGMHPRQADEN